MIYAMSDIHGCYDKYIAMIDKIHLMSDDTLYILGDVVDRGTDGIKVLQDMMARANVIPLLGNHDYTARTLLTHINRDETIVKNENFAAVLKDWMSDGGTPTIRAFLALSKEDRQRILSYLSTFLIYEELDVAGKAYFLSHTVPEKESMQDFDALTVRDFIIGEPDYDEEYYADKYIVTGHTPTPLIEAGCRGIYQKHNHIAIDCGAVFGGRLGCIRLDDLQKYYVE